MAKKKLELVEDIEGWGMTLDMVNSGFQDVTDQDTVIIPINSYGGSVMEGTAIYNIIKGSNARTEAHILGYAMSMGTVIASGADEVVMPENGYYMIHEPSMVEWGDADTFADASAFLNTIGMDAAKIYAKKTGKTVDEIRSMMKATTWMNAQEALELGFVDRLSEGTEINAALDPKLFANAPDALLMKAKEEKSFMEQVAGLLPKSFFKQDDTATMEQDQRIADLQAKLHTEAKKVTEMSALLDTAKVALEEATTQITELTASNTTQAARIVELEAMDAAPHLGAGAGDAGEPEVKLYHQTPLSKKRRELIAQNNK